MQTQANALPVMTEAQILENPAFKLANVMLDAIKELLVSLAMNQSKFGNELTLVPSIQHDVATIDLRIRLVEPALLNVDALNHYNATKAQVESRTIHLQQRDDQHVEVTYLVTVDGDIEDWPLKYSIDQASSARDAGYITEDLFDFLMHGTVMGEFFGEA